MGTTKDDEQDVDKNPMHATMSVILAAAIVFFLSMVVIVIYCTSEQRRKTKRKNAKRLSRDEGKRTSNNHERNNRENEIITENPNRFKPDNQTTRNINGRYNGSNHESISLLNVSQITHPFTPVIENPRRSFCSQASADRDEGPVRAPRTEKLVRADQRNL